MDGELISSLNTIPRSTYNFHLFHYLAHSALCVLTSRFSTSPHPQRPHPDLTDLSCSYPASVSPRDVFALYDPLLRLT